MFCEKCGSQVKDVSKFCPVCGALQAASSPPEPSLETQAYREEQYNGSISEEIKTNSNYDSLGAEQFSPEIKPKKRGPVMFAILVAILVLIGTGVFVFSQVFFHSNPKVKIYKAITGVTDEFKNTLNDFMPDVKPADMYQDYYENGRLEFGTTFETGQYGMFQFFLKSNPLDAKSEVGLNNDNKLFLSLSAIDNNLYLNAPEFLDYSLFVNTKEVFKKLADLNPEEMLERMGIPSYYLDYYLSYGLMDWRTIFDIIGKNKQGFELYGKYRTLKQIVNGYLEYVKDDIDEFAKELEVEETEIEEDLIEMVEEASDLKLKGKQYNFTLKASKLAKFVKKYFEFYVDEVFPVKGIEEIKSLILLSLSGAEGKADFSLVIDKGRLVAIKSYSKKDQAGALIVFAGKDNSTDRIIGRRIYEDELTKYNKFEFVLEKNGSDKVLSIGDGKNNLELEYSEGSKMLSFSAEGETVEAKVKDSSKGKSFVLKFESFGGNSTLENLDLEVSVSVDKPSIEEPKSAKDVFEIDDYNELFEAFQKGFLKFFNLNPDLF